jgi:hypothetical protein
MGLVNGEANMISSLITSMGGESGAISWTRRVLELLPMESRYSLARTCKWMYNCAVESELPIFQRVSVGNAVATMRLDMVMFLHAEKLLIPGGLGHLVRHDLAFLCFKAGKWIVDSFLASETDVFHWATYNDCFELIEYAFEHDWDRELVMSSLNYSFGMLELLYTRKALWKDFCLSEIQDTSMREDGFIFLLVYRLDPMFNLRNALKSDEFSRALLRNLRMIRDIMVLRSMIDIWIHAAQGPVPLDICARMEARIRKEFECLYCECQNPERHEDLLTKQGNKRIKL